MELLKMVYAYLVRTRVKQIRKENCEACRIDHPSQQQHMGNGGCLQDMLDSVDIYMNKALVTMSMEQALKLVRAVFEKFNHPLNPIFEAPLAESLPSVTSADIYTYCLLQHEDYDELFEDLSD